MQVVNIDAGVAARFVFVRTNNDALGIQLINHTATERRNGGARVAGNVDFHAGADERRIRLQQWHRLPLHVGAHQRAVGVVVLQERNERGRDRHKLLRRHVHIFNLLTRQQLGVACFAGADQIIDKGAVGGKRQVGLSHTVLAFLYGRHIGDFVRHFAVHDLAVRAFDKAVLVDAGKGGQRVDQADVRAFRRFNRADAAIVGRMHVAHFEAGALTGQTARAKRRKAAFVGDFRQRVGLVHELRKLRGTEELAHRSSRGLCIDQVLRHHRINFNRAHAFADGAFHAQQANAVLVFQQLADRADTAVAQMVDIVDFADTVLQADQGLNDSQHIGLAQHPHGVRRIQVEAGVHLHTADGGKVIAFAIEKQRLEHGISRFRRRRLARTHDAVDVVQRVFALHVFVEGQRVADVWPDIDHVDGQQFQLVDAGLTQGLEQFLCQFVTGFGVDSAVFHVDDVKGDVAAEQFNLFHQLPGGA